MKRKTYDNVTEAGWYALKPFIDPLDCSVDHAGAVVNMNDNDCWHDLLNNKLRYYVLDYFSKARYHAHVVGAQTYHYRGSHRGNKRTGYGRGQQARKLDWCQELGITTAASTDENTYVLLLGIDIDAHHGQDDATELKKAIVAEFFPDSYVEQSKSGGWHIYFKLEYVARSNREKFQQLEYIRKICKYLYTTLSVTYDYFDSKIDTIRGLPSELCFQDETLVIKRSASITIPRLDSMDDVRYFHSLPYYSLDDIRDLIVSDIDNNSNSIVSNTGKNNKTDILCSKLDELYDVINPEIEPDAFVRKATFLRCHYLDTGAAPSLDLLDDYVKEYMSLGLSPDNSADSKARNTFVSLIKNFDTSKITTDINSTYEQSYAATSAVYVYITNIAGTLGVNVSYLVGKHEREITEDDIRTAWVVIEHCSKNKQDIVSIGRDGIVEYFRLLGKQCNQKKATGILKVFKATGMLEKLKGYIPGKKCTTYRINRNFEGRIRYRCDNRR